MEDAELSAMIGNRVWIKIQKRGEVEGIITAVIKPFADPDEYRSVDLTKFAVRLDSGEEIQIQGSTFSRIDK